MSAGTPGLRIARVEAQAKVNLFLRVLAQEPSGYHQLETLFQRIALADAVTVTVGDGVAGRSLDCTGADAGPTEQNVAWRAALAFADAVGQPLTFRIEIEKRIPVGGGLGGGSADAAAVLRALNALAERPLDQPTLARIAFAIGADVPYLASPHALALGGGRGEQMYPLEALPAHDVVLAVPPFGVSSGAAFGWFAADKARRRAGTRATLPVGRKPEWRTVAALAANDLEAVVDTRHPELVALRDLLRAHGAMLARMSGSGSTVFGVFDAPVDAGLIAAIEATGARAIRTATIERVAEVVAA